MPPALFQIGRALLVALAGALATVICNKIDKLKGEDDEQHNTH